MPDLFTTIGPLTLRSYTLFLWLAVLGGLALAAWRARRRVSFAAMADAALGALIGGVLGARLTHVVLTWNYFSVHPEEITRLNFGGFDWHGAVVGGLLGLLLVARWRRLGMAPLLDAAAPALPLLGALLWYGCWAWACGYGAEVDTLANYPAYAVSESRDVYGFLAPRYNTQAFGVVLSLGVFGLTLLTLAARPLRVLRFWLALALLGAGMFVIGFVRGDAAPFVAGLRLDQWFDLAMVLLSLSGIIVEMRRRRAASPGPAPASTSD